MTEAPPFAPTHIVAHNVLPIYAAPRRGSEQTSQAVFGAPLQVLRTDGDFSFARGDDRYSGWVRTSFLTPFTDTSDYFATTIAPLFAEVLSEPNVHVSPLTRLTAGARVLIAHQPEVDPFVPILMLSKGIGFVHRGYLTSTYEEQSAAFSWPGSRETGRAMQARILEQLRERIEQVGRRFVGVPYLWGGTTPFGLDCSGFVQLVYRLNGILLLRDASLQCADRRFEIVSENVPLADAVLAPGDLVFFGTSQDAAQKITHVGLALGDGTFAHSAGRDRGNLITTCLDAEFGATYAGARRLSADADLAVEAA